MIFLLFSPLLGRNADKGIMKVSMLKVFSGDLGSIEKEFQKLEESGNLNRFPKKYFIRKKNTLTVFVRLL